MKRYIVLPWFLYPLTACWDCHVKFSTPCKLFHEHIKVHIDNQKHVDNEQFLKRCFLKLWFLQTISKFLKVPFGSLLSFEQQKKELRRILHWVKNVETYLFQEMCKTVGDQDILTTFIVNSPNYTIFLLHWKFNSNIPNLFNKTFIIKLNVWYIWERVQRNSLQRIYYRWYIRITIFILISCAKETRYWSFGQISSQKHQCFRFCYS